ncbi:ABC transporter ATP-binding protein [Oligella ureolytica]
MQSQVTQSQTAVAAVPESEIILDVNGIEVIYNHVILVLRGVSLAVPKGKICLCWR